MKGAMMVDLINSWTESRHLKRSRFDSGISHFTWVGESWTHYYLFNQVGVSLSTQLAGNTTLIVWAIVPFSLASLAGKLCTNNLKLYFHYCSQQARTLEGGNRYFQKRIFAPKKNTFQLYLKVVANLKQTTNKQLPCSPHETHEASALGKDAIYSCTHSSFWS